jgi:hypothetical protein
MYGPLQLLLIFDFLGGFTFLMNLGLGMALGLVLMGSGSPVSALCTIAASF